MTEEEESQKVKYLAKKLKVQCKYQPKNPVNFYDNSPLPSPTTMIETTTKVKHEYIKEYIFSSSTQTSPSLK